MRNIVAEISAHVQTMVFERVPVTVLRVCDRSGFGQKTVRRVLRELRVEYTSESDLIKDSYYGAVVAARAKDQFGIVSDTDLARERNTGASIIRRYFQYNPDLRKKWSVLKDFAARRARILRAVEVLRKEHGDKPIWRRHVAEKIGDTLGTLTQYFLNNKRFEQSLGLQREPARNNRAAGSSAVAVVYREALNGLRKAFPTRRLTVRMIARRAGKKIRTARAYIHSHPELRKEYNIHIEQRREKAKTES